MVAGLENECNVISRVQFVPEFCFRPTVSQHRRNLQTPQKMSLLYLYPGWDFTPLRFLPPFREYLFVDYVPVCQCQPGEPGFENRQIFLDLLDKHALEHGFEKESHVEDHIVYRNGDRVVHYYYSVKLHGPIQDAVLAKAMRTAIAVYFCGPCYVPLPGVTDATLVLLDDDTHVCDCCMRYWKEHGITVTFVSFAQQ